MYDTISIVARRPLVHGNCVYDLEKTNLIPGILSFLCDYSNDVAQYYAISQFSRKFPFAILDVYTRMLACIAVDR